MSAELSDKLRQCASRIGGGNELARQTGIPRRTLENYLNGNTEPVPSRLIAIAEAAGADLLWLLCGAGEFREARPLADPAPSGYDARLEQMRLISAALRQAVGEREAAVDRRLWTDLQGLAYIHNFPHEAIPALVDLIVRAYQDGTVQGAKRRRDREHT